jgi:folylpolyglutamate synthase/dihydropteroate synthase
MIAEYIVSRGAHATVVLDPREAVRHARELSGEDDQIIVAGSLYLVGDVRAGLLALPYQHR